MIMNDQWERIWKEGNMACLKKDIILALSWSDWEKTRQFNLTNASQSWQYYAFILYSPSDKLKMAVFWVEW